MSGGFEGKVAIVTGGGSGIGRAAAMLFAGKGARVVVADIVEASAVETAAAIEAAGGKAIALRTDVTDAGAIQAMVEATMERFGRLDVAFNNAGHPGHFHDVVGCTVEEWETVFARNVTSVWQCMKYQIPAMLENGGGAIVNTASMAGLQATPTMAAYIASKHAVVGLTRSAALDFGGRNIRVNVLAPGPTLTPMMEQAMKGVNATAEQLSAGLAIKRMGTPQEQAEAAVWLCSDAASYITGVALPVDGGMGIC
jgi:NAD(P)-dependent dehydrogenase (short-subunit alcohol dehydrogenase family)